MCKKNPGKKRSFLIASAHLPIICSDKDKGGGHTKPEVREGEGKGKEGKGLSKEMCKDKLILVMSGEGGRKGKTRKSSSCKDHTRGMKLFLYKCSFPPLIS